MELLLKQAVTGSSEAQYELAICYFTGRKGPVSLSEGLRWLEYAAAAHHTFANAILQELKEAVLRAIKNTELNSDIPEVPE